MDTAHLNRLAGASSPYLLLHRHNPVDWYPWGDEALARARREDKPIFLSVGYSTCYWCHVMERESFSDPAIAAAMNDSFVNVKLDREERPDLDEVYMVATQVMTGQGGWPNSVFLTPDLRPFFAGTYFPPEDRWGRPGFRSLLAGIAGAWQQRRDEVEEQARELAGAVGHYLEHTLAPAAQPPGAEVTAAALRSLAERYDPHWGGFGEAPKFPSPANLLLLLERSEDERARQMLAVTLDRMARGGIHDQLAGGFHRYATDREWRVPHFEKMLYDNGSLLEIYARGWALLGDPQLARVVRATVAFLERELSAPEGGFWSAIDAETGGREGAYYVWTRAELEEVLGGEDAAFLAPLLGFDGPPFFEGTEYVLHLPLPLAEAAQRRRLAPEALYAAVEPLRERLLARRAERPRPLTDDKVLADWNGMTIAGLAVAGRLLGEPDWVRRAGRAADFLLGSMRTAGMLVHAWRQGRGEVPAFLADYAHVVHGLLALHAATKEERWLTSAVELSDEQRRRLAHEDGGFYSAAAGPDLLFRSREVFDGASPSPNGIAVLNLLRLAEVTGEARWREEARRALRACGPMMEAQPAAARTLAVALARYHAAAGPAGEVAPPSSLAPEAALPPEGSEPAASSRAVAALEAEALSAVHARLEVGTEAEGWRPFRLLLTVAPGWHVSAEGGPAGLLPLQVSGVGCELSDLSVEPPAALVGDGVAPVHEGSVRVQGRLRSAQGGPPRLRLRYQVCDATRCLPAVTRELAPASGSSPA